MSGTTVTICNDPDDLAGHAANLIVSSAREAIAQRGKFTIALSGGSTPERMHKLLARPEYASRIDWLHTWVFLGDERFVPVDDPRSNLGMAKRTLLDHVPIPPSNIFPVQTWRPNPADAAAAYASTLTWAFGSPPGPPVLDLILLGLGDDGHTASLFPGKPTLGVQDRWVVDSPPGVLPPPVDRVTLTFPVINAARHVAFLVAGANKATVVREVLNGAPVEVYPAAGVRPTAGKLTWLLDRAAGSLVSASP